MKVMEESLVKLTQEMRGACVCVLHYTCNYIDSVLLVVRSVV